jgi:Putative Flp pilus-assembly TadE/G-like
VIGRCRDEVGQTTVLIIGFFVIAVMLIAVVVDASAAFLRRESLDAVADGAALAAADGVAGDQVYNGGLGHLAQIDPAVARSAVEQYLADSDAYTHFPGLSYQVSSQNTSVTVVVTSTLSLPIPVPGVDGSAVIVGTAHAIVPVR